MKELSRKEGKVIRLYSFETKEGQSFKIKDIRLGWLTDDGAIIYFSGTKTELLTKSEEFWKPLVEDSKQHPDDLIDIYHGQIIYKNYSRGKALFTAKESGISSLEGEKEYVIITEENES